VPTFVLLNFEAFQQGDADAMIERLVEECAVDAVILDEVHSAKLRDKKTESARRKRLMTLLGKLADKKPDLYVLGMSATPVINNLEEAKSLLEMIRGQEYPDLKTRPTVNNVLAVHQQLVMHGVRWKPRYSMTLNPAQFPEVVGDEALARKIRGAGRTLRGNMLKIEQALLPTKIPAIMAEMRPGTLVYTQFVDGMVPLLVKAIRAAGFTVATYAGNDKREEGFDGFVRGDVDVLVGSEKIQQGVDGLQKRCNRLVIASVPWTGAGYEQLIGRIYRQGSHFDHVDVIIPQVVLDDRGDSWSFDRNRYERILSKKTLGDATVDGKIPEDFLESTATMTSRSLQALDRSGAGALVAQGCRP
jgi:hypothetical protein